MEKFEISILGCGSALPTTRHLPSSQIVNFRENLFMIDCGEGVQQQLRRTKQKFSRLAHIFLSHMHGDHVFGLPGLISTLGLLGRTGDLFVYAHADAEKVFRPILDYFCKDLPFEVKFITIDPTKHEVIYEDRSLRVWSLPLKHRVPTCGFLFEEKPRLQHLKPDMIEFWQIPIRDLHSIKEGQDWVAPDGTLVKNSMLTRMPIEPRKYAYCSDTAYTEKIFPWIEGVDVLFHEATFTEEERQRAKHTFHSTAAQAAQVASKAKVRKLVIGHFSARYEDDTVLLKEAKQGFDNVILAKEGLKIELK